MTGQELHVLEREYQHLRGGRRVAPWLRAEMEDLGVSAKELSLLIKAWARQDPKNRQALDYRTIQHAMDGTCALETYFSLSGYFGWDFIEEVQTPVVGADPITAREAELDRHQAQVAAIHARLERDRAARSADPDLGRGRAVRPLQGRGVSRAGAAQGSEAVPDG